MNKRKATLSELLLAFGLFFVFTVCVMVLDVQPIGPEGSRVGMASVNAAFFSAFGQNSFWESLSEILGLVSIALGCCYALLFVAQWVKRKKIFLVDRHLWSFGLLMFYVVLSYLFFELFVINVRPIMGEKGLEASYPSSHTMLVVSVLSFSFSRVKYYVKKPQIVAACRIVFALIMALVVIARLFSGVHWFSDILGALLLSNFLYTLNEFSAPFLDRVCED